MATQKPFMRSWGGWLGLLTMIAGLWFLISPGILGFGATNTAGLNAITRIVQHAAGRPVTVP